MANDLKTPVRKKRQPARHRREEPPSFAFEPVRTRLVEELLADGRVPAKLTTVVAPTGYGKTVLCSTLFRHFCAGPVQGYWIALDDRDTTTERVLGQLETALGEAGVAVHPTQALILGDEPLENRMEALIDDLGHLPGPVLIAIDNLGYCTDETLGYLLDRLVFRTPSSVHFLFSSTEQVPMNLARAKLESRLREIGFRELGMQVSEVRDLLGPGLCEQLGEAGVQTVARHTEGWPAAVRLAQIILSTAERPLDALARFSGADEDLADLLNRQVLAGFAPDERGFLLRISLLRSFCADLCRHASGEVAAARHLGMLLRRNVFVIPLDRNRSWYRLHGLFREFLVEEAHRELDESERRAVLERAAEWCERNGQWQDAIDYAIAAGSAELAVAVLERVAAMFVRDRGDLRQYIEWVERLRAGGHEVGWDADLWYVWALVFHRRYDYARVQYERIARRLEQERLAGGDPVKLGELSRRAQVIRICVDTYTDRQTDAYEQGTQWLAGRAADDPFDVATIASAVGITLCAEHRFVEAREVMRTAQAAIAQTHSGYGAGWVSVLSAMVAVQEGDYAAVHNDLLATWNRVRAELGDGAGIGGTIALVAARCAVEMNLDDEARELLTAGLRWAHTHGIVDTAAVGIEAAVKLWSGRDDEAISIPQIREIAAGYAPRLSLMLSCLLVQRLVRLGRLDDALAEGAHIGLDIRHPERRETGLQGLEVPATRDLYAAAEIDLLIAAGQLRQAEALIAEQTRLARKDGRMARLVELALAETALAVCSHNPQPATRHLVRAIGLAAKRRILRPFRDRAELIAGMVNDTKPSAWGFALEEERSFFVEICRGLPISGGSLAEELHGDGQLLETPTARELELLGLIEAGLSNQQLADRLSVSVATIKWHLYNLYTKLGVSSRSAALARAKSLSLLSR